MAVARKLSVLLHRLWITGEVYEPLYYARTAGADPEKTARACSACPACVVAGCDGGAVVGKPPHCGSRSMPALPSGRLRGERLRSRPGEPSATPCPGWASLVGPFVHLPPASTALTSTMGVPPRASRSRTSTLRRVPY